MNTKTLLFLGLSLAQCFSLATSQAADNTAINVTANIVASPCTISTSELNIDLGDIQATKLEAPGSTSDWSPVSKILLTNCPASTTSVIAHFGGGGAATNGDVNGYQNLGMDKSISVELADDSPTPYYLSQGKELTTNVVNHSAEFDVKARLYSSGNSTPGQVGSTVQVVFYFK